MHNGLAIGVDRIPIRNEADFFIHELVPVKFFGSTVYITTTHVCAAIIIVTIMILAVCARNSVLKHQDNPTKFSAGVEIAIETLLKFVHGSMGEAGKHYINYIGAIFIYIFLSNISGLFGLRPPTADYGTTLCLALITFVMIQYAAIRYKKWGAFTDLFQPVFFFFPMNVISELATPLSLSLRLFGNILAGTVMISLYYGLIPVLFRFGIPAFLHIYLDLFSGAIQAYVFTMLTMTFVFDKRNVE